MYGSILVPTDGSEHAIRAAEHGSYLARAFDATVHLVSAADIQTAGGMFNAGGVDPEFVERVEAENEQAIETTEAAFEGDEALQTRVLRGKPTEAITEYIDEHDIDVVAMGTRGRTGIQRYVLGSVTERVVRRAPCPVLTVRAGERRRSTDGYSDIMIPTDGSEPAAAAIDHGLAIAQAAGARIHAVNMVDTGAITATHRTSSAPKRFEQLRSNGESATETIATRAEAVGLDATTTVSEGVPASGLLEYAEEHEIDLITMATTGRTGLDRYLLGSTAERVIRHAEMPVLAVNARAQTD